MPPAHTCTGVDLRAAQSAHEHPPQARVLGQQAGDLGQAVALGEDGVEAGFDLGRTHTVSIDPLQAVAGLL